MVRGLLRHAELVLHWEVMTLLQLTVEGCVDLCDDMIVAYFPLVND
jgi:hypothetical protein